MAKLGTRPNLAADQKPPANVCVCVCLGSGEGEFGHNQGLFLALEAAPLHPRALAGIPGNSLKRVARRAGTYP